MTIKLQRRRRAFSIIELLVVIAVIAAAIPALDALLKSMKISRGATATREKIHGMDMAFRHIYRSNLSYAEDHCSGWDSGNCRSLALTPVQVGPNTLRLLTYDTSAISMLKGIGCEITGGAPNFTFKCRDGYQHYFKFTVKNGHTPGSDYIAPFQGSNPSIRIQSTKGADVTLTMDDLINYSFSLNDQKLSDIANGIKAYVRSIRIRELGNDCSGTAGSKTNPPGGLGSWDDPLVPWGWEIVSSSPGKLCSGTEGTATGCGCLSHKDSRYWEKGSSWCKIDTSAEFDRFLHNLQLGKKYMLDGFGNRYTIVPTADANGNPTSCPPPRPQPSYPGAPTLGKFRIGTYYNGTWYGYIDVYSE